MKPTPDEEFHTAVVLASLLAVHRGVPKERVVEVLCLCVSLRAPDLPAAAAPQLRGFAKALAFIADQIELKTEEPTQS